MKTEAHREVELNDAQGGGLGGVQGGLMVHFALPLISRSKEMPLILAKEQQ